MFRYIIVYKDASYQVEANRIEVINNSIYLISDLGIVATCPLECLVYKVKS